jgi:hypothetical protein
MNEPLAPNEYRCSHCHHVYTKAWTDKEALQELQETWPGVSKEECGIICDDCWQAMTPLAVIGEEVLFKLFGVPASLLAEPQASTSLHEAEQTYSALKERVYARFMQKLKALYPEHPWTREEDKES